MEDLTQLDAAVAALSRVDLTALPLASVQDLAVRLEQVAGQLRGIASQALSVVADADPAGAAWWWRDAVGITGEAAGHAVRRARGLTSLPLVSQAVIDGDLSLEQAGALVPLVGKVPELELHDMQPMLLEGCRGRTVDSIGQWVRVLLAVHAEHNLDDEQATAEKNRLLKWRLGADGTVRGRFILGAEKAEPFLTAIEALSRRQGIEDTREAGQRRADALIELAELYVRHGDLPHTGGQRAQVSYVVPADWAARTYRATGALGAWTGPQTRSHIETVLCDARISRVLLDSTGQVHSLETLNDQITLAQRRAITARDHHCTAHGCTRSPAFCDVHHLTHREHGGPTTVENLVLLCRRHHGLWHDGILKLTQLRLPWLDTSGERTADGRPPDDPRAGPFAA